jgi:hypothetical protein
MISKITTHYMKAQSGKNIKFYRVFTLSGGISVLPCRLTAEQRAQAIPADKNELSE